MLQKIVIPFLVIVVTGLSIAVGVLYRKQPRIAYAELSKVYSEFTMKNDLEKQLKITTDMRTKTLDSLELNLNILTSTLKNFEQQGNKKGIADRMPEYDRSRQEYMATRQRFEEDNEALSSQYTAQIWKQINQYAKEFGKEQGFSFVLGADGSGAVMFADESTDITTELVAYVNRQYKGAGGVK